ncbi:MAG: VanZ family protein [Chromatocurvus sp.]
MRALLVVMAVLIFYGSIYPLTFSAHTYTPERMAQLVDFDLAGESRGNIIANTLLFIPFGVFSAIAASRERRTRGRDLALFSVSGLIVAYLAQVAQVFIASRVPSGADVAWNLVGMVLGLLVGLALVSSRFRLPTLTGPLPIPLLLVAGWLAYQWIPFVPTLDLGLLRDNAIALTVRRTPSPFWVFQNTVLWLICYQLVERYAPGIRHRWFPLVTFFVLGMGGLLVGSTVNVDDFAGALCALVLWRILGARWSPAALALLLALAIVGASYLSLTLRETPASFSWIPFSGSLGGNLIINVMATWKKLVLYGLLIWLLLEARLTLTLATIAATILLFVSEWFQVYVKGATPEITDALLALGIGVAMAVHGERPRQASVSTSKAKDARQWRAAPLRGRLIRFAVAGTGLALMLALVSTLPDNPTAVVRNEVPWAWQRADLIADLQTPARTSNGSLEGSDLVTGAVGAGCDILAVTDHSDVAPSGGDKQRQSIAALRREHPELLLFLGMELELPYRGGEHMSILLHPEQEAEWLPRLRHDTAELRDPKRGKGSDRERSVLHLVKRIRDAGHPAFLIYNHPPRKAPSIDEGLKDLQRWRRAGIRVDAIAAAEGVWDRYLESGKDLWGALASSDFQSGHGDARPCDFSRIHIAAPERSHTGVLQALEAGTFWSDHGQLLEHLSLEVEFDGISRPLFPGERADVFTSNSIALARAALERGKGSMNAPLEVEFISNCVAGQSQVITRQLLPGESTAETLIPLQTTEDSDKSCIIRVQVRLNQFGLEPDLLASTNYVRVNMRLGVLDGGILDWRLY